jgi:hypothetical protein
MSSQPESRIVNAILARLNATPSTYARKTHGNRYSAQWPDIVGCANGRMFAIEVKQPGRKATPRQALELAKWQSSGALAGVATSVDEAVDIVWPMVFLQCEIHGTITTPIDPSDVDACVRRHVRAGCSGAVIESVRCAP